MDSSSFQQYKNMCNPTCIITSGGFRGGGGGGGAQPARAPLLKHFSINAPPFFVHVPPLLKFFSINAPPLFVHVPPLLKPKKRKEKKKVSDSARLYPGCYLPPPPPT